MPKMIAHKEMKRGDCEFLFSGNTIVWNGSIIGQYCFYDLPLKEWMRYYQFRGDKRVQRPKLRFLVLILSSFTISHRWGWCYGPACCRISSGSKVIRFYLRIFFDLMGIACVNSYLIYDIKHPNSSKKPTSLPSRP